MACGAWFHASHDVHAYLMVFVNGTHDSSLLAASALMLVAGIALTLISALAIAGILLDKPLFVYIVRTQYDTHTQPFYCSSETTQVSRCQKGKTRQVKTNLNLLEQETVSGSGICWAICKSAPHPR